MITAPVMKELQPHYILRLYFLNWRVYRAFLFLQHKKMYTSIKHSYPQQGSQPGY